MSEAETLCDRVAVIDRGRMLALGTVDELKESQRGEEIVHVTGIIPLAAGDAVRALACVREAAWVPGADGLGRLTVVARTRGERILPELITTLVAHGTVVQQVSPEEVTLEDVFIAHTGRSLAEGGVR
jgi:ABC-2 type transport system ATP-binding protein